MDPVQASRDNVIIWKPVYGHEGYYEVSNTGIVRSVTKRVKFGRNRTGVREGKVLAASPDHYGYPRVTLSLKSRGGGVSYRKVFHLVWEAFMGPHDQRLLRHLDDDKSNSALYNLVPGSHADNMDDKVAIANADKPGVHRKGEPLGFNSKSGWGF